MDGYSPELQVVYSLAVQRQRIGYSDSRRLAVVVMQLPDRHGCADQALGQVELAMRTIADLIGRRTTTCIPPGFVSILLFFYGLERTCEEVSGERCFG